MANERGYHGRQYVASLNHDLIVNEYNNGDSMKAIGKKYNISDATIKKILIKQGCRLRTKLQADKLRGKKERTGQNICCKFCNKKYYAFQGYIDQGRNVFCSQKCHIAYAKSNIKHKSSTCIQCNKDFIMKDWEMRSRSGQFCSGACYHEHQRRNMKEFTCNQCNKKFKIYPGRRKAKLKFCSNQCCRDYRSRENHHNWKGGISPLNELIRGHSKSREWVKSVMKRDDYTCQSCGDRGVELHVHHVRSFSDILQEFLLQHSNLDPKKNQHILLKLALDKKEFFDVNNGESLCLDCHEVRHLSKESGETWALQSEINEVNNPEPQSITST